jgi:hypothetical protein
LEPASFSNSRLIATIAGWAQRRHAYTNDFSSVLSVTMLRSQEALIEGSLVAGSAAQRAGEAASWRKNFAAFTATGAADVLE